MRVTAVDIARQAQVSVGTVSRVLNGHPSVGEDISLRVRQVVEAMQYKPLRRRLKASGSAGGSFAGRPGGATGSTAERPVSRSSSLSRRNLAVVMLGMDRSLELLPVVASALHGAERSITNFGANLLLADSPDLQRAPAWLGQEQIEGVILKGALQGRAIAETHSPLLHALRRLPSVWLLGRPAGAWGDVVGPDDFQIGQMAAGYLVDRGHRRIALVNPKPGHVTFSRREAGLAFEAERRGGRVMSYVPPDVGDWPIPLEPVRNIESVQALVDRVLAEPEASRATTIFCPADSIVVLVYRALSARGVVVGRDISVMSANNEVSLTSGLYPSLVTIDVRARAIGKLAVEQLIWRIANREGPDAPPVDLRVQPELVPGDSVRDLRDVSGGV
jgi:DNA-binding LacI/PurR family transcriptional regulator